VTINFYGAKWCKACQPLLELWQKNATKYGHTLNYIDVDKAPSLATVDDVRSVPTVIIGLQRYQTIGASEIEKVCASL